MLCLTRNLRRKNEKEMKKTKEGREEREAELESHTNTLRIFICSSIKDLLAYLWVPDCGQ